MKFAIFCLVNILVIGSLICSEVFTAFPEFICSNRGLKFPLWRSNPQTLQNLDGATLGIYVTPSKFLMKELNSAGVSFAFILPMKFYGAVGLNYLGSEIFSISSFNASIQREIFDNFSGASSFSLNMFQVRDFGFRLSGEINLWAQYFAYEPLVIGFKYQNMFTLMREKNSIVGLGIQYDIIPSFVLGMDINQNLGKFTTLSLYCLFELMNDLTITVHTNTLPPEITLGFLLNINEYQFLLFLNYNNNLQLTQTFGLNYRF
ncbi:MAG: hypothetical protein N2517_00870 [Ignavibacteria bacterium]|nr:hypothetical protein [Ignavibacteria bacterium]